MTKLKVLVTGSTGLIGSHVTKYLAKAGHQVYALSRSRRKWGNENVNPVISDLSMAEPQLENGIEFVLHFAAYTNIKKSVEEPIECIRGNIFTTANILEYSRKKDVKRILFSSSYHVYDKNLQGCLSETDPIEGDTLYAASKISCETLINSYALTYSLSPIILRLFNIFGPGAGQHQIVPSFINQALTVGQIKPRSKNVILDLLYIDDLLELIGKCLKAEIQGTFNVGSGQGVDIYTLANIIAQIVEEETGGKIGVEFPCDSTPVDRKIAKIDKIQKKIRWVPKVSLDEGLRKTIKSQGEANV